MEYHRTSAMKTTLCVVDKWPSSRDDAQAAFYVNRIRLIGWFIPLSGIIQKLRLRRHELVLRSFSEVAWEI